LSQPGRNQRPARVAIDTQWIIRRIFGFLFIDFESPIIPVSFSPVKEVSSRI